ncbi:hypothetical protein [Actinospongicola halichondriae]|uniref:hypothetical protein n=1 Tax=Actinospongicola halichondriae TaxID=3236844 RepID=UPI003D5C70D0
MGAVAGGDDAWLDRLRDALAEAHVEDEAEQHDVDDWPDPEPEVTREPVPPSRPSTPASPSADLALIVDTLAGVTTALTGLSDRVSVIESAGRESAQIDQVELDVVVADAIRQSMTRAQATGAGTTRLETEVRVLEETVGRLTKRVGELNIAALARDRLEKDVHVERLADAADAVAAQVRAAVEARQSFDAGVEKMLDHARTGDGENVAWTDVMFLTHELRSRVDDLDDQQRRAMRDLSDWQASVDDRLSALRGELLSEIRRIGERPEPS